MLLTDKYAPKKLDDLIGHDEPKQKLRSWILHWVNNQAQKPLLLCGPSGIGKTSMVLALVRELNLELIELNASMLRNKQAIERTASTASLASSLFGRQKLILIDDAEVFERQDRGGIAALSDLLKNPSQPYILTVDDPWAKKLSPVRMLCQIIQLRRPGTPSIKKLLLAIAKSESIAITDEEISKIADNANGDVRSAINDLQCGGSGMRDRKQDIFHQVRDIFKARSYSDAVSVASGNVDYDILKLWIDENIPYEYENPEDLANAFNCLSRADIFEGRIRKSRWILLRYCIALATGGVAMSKKHPYYKFTKYQFPSYLKQMSASMRQRAMRKSVCSKVGARTHTSVRDAQSYLPLLYEMALKDEALLASLYEFDEDELAFILGTSVGKLKKE